VTTPEERTSPDSLQRLLPLESYLEANEIPWLVYLVNLMKGLAPPPIVIGDEAFLDRGDEAAFRSRLRGEALRRMGDLARETEPVGS
jgi:hypothetical protein